MQAHPLPPNPIPSEPPEGKLISRGMWGGKEVDWRERSRIHRSPRQKLGKPHVWLESHAWNRGMVAFTFRDGVIRNHSAAWRVELADLLDLGGGGGEEGNEKRNFTLIYAKKQGPSKIVDFPFGFPFISTQKGPPERNTA